MENVDNRTEAKVGEIPCNGCRGTWCQYCSKNRIISRYSISDSLPVEVIPQADNRGPFYDRSEEPLYPHN
jgi:hypothetical protein